MTDMPKDRSASALAKVARMNKAMNHEEPDRVPMGEFYWGSFLRRWMMSHFRESPGHFVGRLLTRDSRWLCGELAAYCLDCQPEYADRGVLEKPRHPVDPQELFEDGEIFANWSTEPEDGPKSLSMCEG